MSDIALANGLGASHSLSAMDEQQWYSYAPVGPEFLDRAPLRFRIEAVTALPVQKVWDAFADTPGWVHWFPFVERALYEGPTPYGVGTIRKSWVSGDRYEETMLIWDEPRRWGYRIDRATQGIAKAQLELTEFEDAPGGGTRVIWILASDPLPNLNYLAGDQDFIAFLKDILERALRSLEAHIAKGAR